MKRTKREGGAIAIEAAISLTVFMLAISGIMLFSIIVRTQSLVNYALNQTAKEISGYFYLVDKLGLTEMLSGVNGATTQEGLKKMNNAINSITAFSSDVTDGIEDVSGQFQGALGVEYPMNENSGLDSFTLTPEGIQQFEQQAQAVQEYIDTQTTNVENITGAAKDALDQWQKDVNNIKGCFEDLSKDPMQTVKAVLLLFSRSMVNKAFSRIVTPVICEWLVPKYLTDGKMEDFCKTASIIPESVSFSESKMLVDGRTIRLVMEYQMDLSRWTLGFGGTLPVTMRSVACTAAWIRPDSSMLRSLEAVGKLNSTKKYFDPDYEIPEETVPATTATTAETTTTTQTTSTGSETTDTTDTTTTTTTETTTTTTTTPPPVPTVDAFLDGNLKTFMNDGNGSVDYEIGGSYNENSFFENIVNAQGKLVVDKTWYNSLTAEQKQAEFGYLDTYLQRYNASPFHGEFFKKRTLDEMFELVDNSAYAPKSLDGHPEITNYHYVLPKHQAGSNEVLTNGTGENTEVRYSDHIAEKVTYSTDTDTMFECVKEMFKTQDSIEITNPGAENNAHLEFKGYDKNGLLWKGVYDDNQKKVISIEPCFEGK